MPNQRSKNKVYLGGFVERDLEKRIIQTAARSGMQKNKFGFVVQLIEEGLQRRGAKSTRGAEKKGVGQKTGGTVRARRTAGGGRLARSVPGSARRASKSKG